MFNIGDHVEIIFNYFDNYLPEDHEHTERIYFSTIIGIETLEEDLYLYELQGFKLCFYKEDLKKV